MRVERSSSVNNRGQEQSPCFLAFAIFPAKLLVVGREGELKFPAIGKTLALIELCMEG